MISLTFPLRYAVLFISFVTLVCVVEDGTVADFPLPWQDILVHLVLGYAMWGTIDRGIGSFEHLNHLEEKQETDKLRSREHHPEARKQRALSTTKKQQCEKEVQNEKKQRHGNIKLRIKNPKSLGKCLEMEETAKDMSLILLESTLNIY
ncbi:hypothetical protein RJT34_32868 [Clitoria ternatea]|uniref:Uncharacterized protein n=1 Tax=Clitoria ternatea TaxID=43366 RepID=A0AAN9EYW2_CLITE